MAKSKMNWLQWVVVILLIAGGLNWGLVALGWNLVNWITFGVGWLETIIYGLVGLSAIYKIVWLFMD